MKRFLILALALSLSCAHQKQKKFQQYLEKQDCDGALKRIPYKTGQQLPGGQALSYGATGAAYTADVLITVVGGVVVFTVLCGPGVAATAISKSGQAAGCFGADLDLKTPTLGKQTYEATQQWRCPELTRFSDSLRQVATCYQKRDDPENLQKAKANLMSLMEHKLFFKCVEENERKNVRELYEAVERQLKSET